MKVSTREVMQKNADYRRAIVEQYVQSLEKVLQDLQNLYGLRQEVSSREDIARAVGKAMGEIRHVVGGLREYFLKE